MKFGCFIMILILQLKYFHLNNVKTGKNKLIDKKSLMIRNTNQENLKKFAYKETSYISIQNSDGFVSKKETLKNNEGNMFN